MGNNQSLRRAIQHEKWHDVRHVLNTEDGRARARTKAYTVSDENVTALHLACHHKAPADVIDTLIVTGQPMMESSPSRLSPLHFALMTKPTASPEVVRLLLNAFPHDVAKPSSNVMGSKMPIHYACEQKASSAVIRMLHEADPSIAQVQDASGNTAMDVAREHMWLFNPKWRRKVKNILEDEHGSVTENQQHPDEIPSQRPFSPSHIRRASSSPRPSSPQTPPVATATLVTESNTAASQLPVASATPVTTVTPTAPPDTMDDPGLEEKGICVLCWENKAEMALVPCGHVCLCTNCCGQGQVLDAALQHQCPICRSAFTQTLRVYHAGISPE